MVRVFRASMSRTVSGNAGYCFTLYFVIPPCTAGRCSRLTLFSGGFYFVLFLPATATRAHCGTYTCRDSSHWYAVYNVRTGHEATLKLAKYNVAWHHHGNEIWDGHLLYWGRLLIVVTLL